MWSFRELTDVCYINESQSVGLGDFWAIKNAPCLQMAFFRNINNNRDTWHQVIDWEPENFTVMVITETVFLFSDSKLITLGYIFFNMCKCSMADNGFI